MLGCLGLCLYLVLFPVAFVERAASHILLPVLYVSHLCAYKLRALSQAKVDYATMLERYHALFEDNESIKQENIALHAALDQFKRSADLHSFMKKYTLSDKLQATILARNITTDQHFFLLNKGARDGVKKDMVALYKFQIIGKVYEVCQCYSKVKLITDKSCNIAGYAAKNHAHGVVQGSNNIGFCAFTYVDQSFKLEAGDIVISSGQGLVFPEGFGIGKICQPNNRPDETQQLYQTFDIEPLVDLSSLEFCFLTDYTQRDLF